MADQWRPLANLITVSVVDAAGPADAVGGGPLGGRPVTPIDGIWRVRGGFTFVRVRLVVGDVFVDGDEEEEEEEEEGVGFGDVHWGEREREGDRDEEEKGPWGGER